MKTPQGLWQYYRNEPALNNNGTIIDFHDNTDSISFKFKQKMTCETGNDGTKYV